MKLMPEKNQEFARIMNSEIMKCKDPLYKENGKTGPNIILYPTLLKILLSTFLVCYQNSNIPHILRRNICTLQHFSSLSNTYVAMLKSIPKGLGYFCDHRLQNSF